MKFTPQFNLGTLLVAIFVIGAFMAGRLSVEPQLNSLKRQNSSLLICLEDMSANEMETNNALLAYQKRLMEQFDVTIQPKAGSGQFFEKGFIEELKRSVN